MGHAAGSVQVGPSATTDLSCRFSAQRFAIEPARVGCGTQPGQCRLTKRAFLPVRQPGCAAQGRLCGRVCDVGVAWRRRSSTRAGSVWPVSQGAVGCEHFGTGLSRARPSWRRRAQNLAWPLEACHYVVHVRKMVAANWDHHRGDPNALERCLARDDASCDSYLNVHDEQLCMRARPEYRRNNANLGHVGPQALAVAARTAARPRRWKLRRVYGACPYLSASQGSSAARSHELHQQG